MSARGGLVFVTWQRHAGRAEEMAAALGGDAVQVHPAGPGGRRLPVLARYALSAVLTGAELLRRRPSAVVVVNPPVVPGAVVAGYCALTGARFVLDSHTSSFGVKENRVARAVLPLTRLLARRADAVMVAAPEWAGQVARWGGRGLVVHEAPPRQELLAPVRHERPVVLFVGIFAADEPVEEVVGAARLLPGVTFRVTGDLERCPAPLRAAAPANVEFVGFLGAADYWAQVREATALIALTTEPTSVMRAAYEAVYAGRPLVVSDWPLLRELFPAAQHAPNTAEGIAAAVARAVEPEAAQGVQRAHALQAARWRAQRDELLAVLGRARSAPQPPAGAAQPRR